MNNIPGFLSSLGLGMGLAGAVQIVTIGVFQLSKHWEEWIGHLGTGKIETAAEQMERLGKATHLTADEQARLNTLKRQEQAAGQQATAQTAEEKARFDAVNAAVAKLDRGKLIRGLTESATAELIGADRGARAAADALAAREAVLRSYLDSGQFEAARSIDPHVARLRGELRVALEKAASDLLSGAAADATKNIQLANIIRDHAGVFPGGAEDLFRASTPAGMAAAEQAKKAREAALKAGREMIEQAGVGLRDGLDERRRDAQRRALDGGFAFGHHGPGAVAAGAPGGVPVLPGAPGVHPRAAGDHPPVVVNNNVQNNLAVVNPPAGAAPGGANPAGPGAGFGFGAFDPGGFFEDFAAWAAEAERAVAPRRAAQAARAAAARNGDVDRLQEGAQAADAGEVIEWLMRHPGAARRAARRPREEMQQGPLGPNAIRVDPMDAPPAGKPIDVGAADAAGRLGDLAAQGIGVVGQQNRALAAKVAQLEKAVGDARSQLRVMTPRAGTWAAYPTPPFALG